MTTNSNWPGLDNEVINDIDTLVRRSVEGAVVLEDPPGPGNSMTLIRVRDDEVVQPVDLERYLDAPRRSRGTATIHDPQDFTLYVNRLATEHSTCWANESAGSVTLIVNDHDGGPDAGAGEMGWRDHRAVLQLQNDPDWAAWVAANGQGNDQETFAEFLQDQAHAIVSPTAADLLEIVTTFQAAQSGTFGRAIRLDNGDVKMTFQQETTASAGTNGELEIPGKFTIALTPFLGGEKVQTEVWLRHRIINGNLKIGFKLDRPDLVKRRAFEKVRGQIAEQVGNVPVLMGPAPAEVTPESPTAHRPSGDTSGIAREVRELRTQLLNTAVRR